MDKNGKIPRTVRIYEQRRAQWIKLVKYQELVGSTEKDLVAKILGNGGIYKQGSALWLK